MTQRSVIFSVRTIILLKKQLLGLSIQIRTMLVGKEGINPLPFYAIFQMNLLPHYWHRHNIYQTAQMVCEGMELGSDGRIALPYLV